MVNGLYLKAYNIKKVFNRRLIFQNLNFEIVNGQSLIITGKNGSGKSTLIKIIANVLTPTSGLIEIKIDGKKIDNENVYKYIGLVSPYLVLYDEFSAFENLLIFSKIRSLEISTDEMENLLSLVGLLDRKDDLLRTYSSGMKQRMKFASALLHNPPILLLDEPTSNLDEEGKNFVANLVENYRKDKIIIIATNDKEDFRFGDIILNLEEFKD